MASLRSLRSSRADVPRVLAALCCTAWVFYIFAASIGVEGKAPPVLRPRPPSPRPPRSPRPPPPPSPSPPRRALANVRLVRGSGPMGRLEVRAVFSDGTKAWRPLCDDGKWTADDAQTFCKFLGYKHGVPYHQDNVSTIAPNETSSRPLFAVKCDFFTYDDSDPYAHHQNWYYWVPDAIASFSGQTCRFDANRCADPSKVLALKCSSDKKLPPVPSHPPRPPSPPPPPPDMYEAIRFIMPEPNLGDTSCHYGSRGCGRIELLVNSSADGRTGPPVWAPLCANEGDVAYGEMNLAIALAACKQFLEHTIDLRTSGITASPDAPIAIPASGGNITEGGFDPAKVPYWVTVTGGADNIEQRSVQSMELKVSTTPCSSGYLSVTHCGMWMT